MFHLWGPFLFLQSKYNTFKIGGGQKSKSESKNKTFGGQWVTDGQTHNQYKDIRIGNGNYYL